MVDGGVLGINLLGVISKPKHLIVVDTMRNKGKPGDLYRLEGDAIPERIRAKNSLHQVDFLEALTLCQALDNVPQTVIIGVEPEDIQTLSLVLTPTVQAQSGAGHPKGSGTSSTVSAYPTEEGNARIMCLAIPSKITKIENHMAVIDVDGVRRESSLLLVEDAQVGDYVIVHAGFAISKIDEQAALETLALLRGGRRPGGRPRGRWRPVGRVVHGADLSGQSGCSSTASSRASGSGRLSTSWPSATA